MVTFPPVTVVAPPAISDASVRTLAAVLGVEGELEHRDGGGQCIGRLEPQGLCVNVPLWGGWQYWDLRAQDGAGASDDQARTIAIELFAHLGVDPGAVTSVKPNGPLPQVEFSSGALPDSRTDLPSRCIRRATCERRSCARFTVTRVRCPACESTRDHDVLVTARNTASATRSAASSGPTSTVASQSCARRWPRRPQPTQAKRAVSSLTALDPLSHIYDRPDVVLV